MLGTKNDNRVLALPKHANQYTVDALIAACLSQDISKLKLYQGMGINLNSIRDEYGDTLLHIAVLNDKPKSFSTLIELGMKIDSRSYYDGSTPLNLAVMADKPSYVQKLIDLGADVNTRADDGFTPLNNAMYFENYTLAQSLLKIPTLDVNIPGFYGMPPLFVPYIDNRWDIIDLIIEHPTYDAPFNQILLSDYPEHELQDYLLNNSPNADFSVVDAFEQSKLFGLKYDLAGCMPFTKLDYHQMDCFSFEGAINLYGTLAMVDSYNLFYENVVLPSNIPSWAQQAFVSVNESLHFTANSFDDPIAYYNKILLGEVVIIPSGWDEHSVAFVIHDDRLYRCNRGDLSDGIHGIEEFIISKPTNLTSSLIGFMLAAEGPPDVLQYDIIELLGLEKIGEIENPVQITGNCVWTSLEAGLEASFLTNFIYQGIESSVAHKLAKDSFLLWEEFDLTYTLKEAISEQDLLIQNEIYDDLLVGALTTHHNPSNETDLQIAIVALNELDKPSVFETFHNEIGKNLINYDPASYSNISYMKPYTPTTYYDYFMSWLPFSKPGMNTTQKEEAKQYLEFLKACDEYQKKIVPEVLNIDNILDFSVGDSLEQLFHSGISNVVQTVSKELPIQHLMPALMPMQEHTPTATIEHFA